MLPFQQCLTKTDKKDQIFKIEEGAYRNGYQKALLI